MPDRDNISGIDGWLLVFLVFLCLVSLTYLVIGAMWLAALSGVSIEFPLITHLEFWMFILLRTAVPAITVWRMVTRKNWSSVRFALIALGGIWVVLPLVDMVGAFWIVTGLVDPALLISFIPGIARDVFMALASALYLLNSKRVAATYPRGRDIDGVFD